MYKELVALYGLLISVYSVYVKYQIEHTKEYTPLCDLRSNISCSKAFTSSYGTLILLPNSVYGVIFYTVFILLSVLDIHTWTMYLALCATLGSLYLAYVSYVVQKNFCLVCNSIYVINVVLLLLII